VTPGPETTTQSTLPPREVTLASIARDLAPLTAARDRVSQYLLDLPAFAKDFGMTATPLPKSERIRVVSDPGRGFDMGAPREPETPALVRFKLSPGMLTMSRVQMAQAAGRARRIAREEARRAYEGPPPTSTLLREWARLTIPGRAWRRWSTARLRRMWRAAAPSRMAAEFRSFADERHHDTVDAVAFAMRRFKRPTWHSVSADGTVVPFADRPPSEPRPYQHAAMAIIDDPETP
jgi:hypothetical protein